VLLRHRLRGGYHSSRSYFFSLPFGALEEQLCRYWFVDIGSRIIVDFVVA